MVYLVLVSAWVRLLWNIFMVGIACCSSAYAAGDMESPSICTSHGCCCSWIRYFYGVPGIYVDVVVSTDRSSIAHHGNSLFGLI